MADVVNTIWKLQDNQEWLVDTIQNLQENLYKEHVHLDVYPTQT